MKLHSSLRFCRVWVAAVLVLICAAALNTAQAQTAVLSASGYFGQILIGSSASGNVTLSNTGTATLNITSIVASGPPFTQTNNCGTSVAAGGKCTITITFTPTTTPLVNGSVTVTDNSTTGSTQVANVSGAGLAPAYLSAVSFGFGNQALNTTSAAKTVTVTNRQTTALPVTVGISGDFAQTNTCGSAIAASGTCTVNMTFTPTAAGTRSGTLTITPSVGPALTASLSGTGISPYTLTPTSLAFGSQAVNTTSAAKTVTLTNNQTVDLGISGITAPAPFAQTTTCGSTLAAGTSCTFSVTFAPTTAGSATGSLSFTVSNGGTLQVGLTGTGFLPVAVTPASLAFGNQATGTTSAAQMVTVKNNQTTSVSGLSVTVSTGSGFAQSATTCTSTLAAGASCTASITFAPTTTGAKTGTVTVSYSGGTSQTVSLTGTGAAAVSFSPTSLTFATQNVGTTSAAQTVTMTNSMNTAMSISSIATAAPFAQTNTCGTSLAAKASCTISVTFAPTVGGAQTGTLTITDNAAGSPQSVALSGTGGASVTITPNTLTFGSQLINTTSAAKTITVTNTSGGRTTVTVSTTGSFAQTNTCSGRIRNNTSCAISVTFTPTAAGAITGALSVTAGSTQTVPLSGTGSSVALAVSPTALAFGNQNTNTSSAAKVVTVTNSQSSAVAIGTITVPVGYTFTSACGTSLAANSSCTVSVVFAPTTGGAVTGNLAIPAGTSTLNVAVSGTGIAPVSILPISGVFPGQPMGVPSAVANWTVKNNLTVSVQITSIVMTGDFSQTNNCTTVASGGSCTIGVTFNPTAAGLRTGSMTVNDNYSGLPQTVVSLSGSGLTDDYLSAVSAAFGNQIVTTVSAAKTITMTNRQPFPMSITGVVMTGDYAQTNNCGTALAANGTCTFNITFTPTVTGARAGSIAINVSPGNNLSASLSGTGIQPPITALPATVSFGPTQAAGGTSASQPITVHNATIGAFTITGITPSANFTVPSHNCPMSPSTFAAGASCTVNVAFAPASTTGVQTQTGTLSIADNATGSPQVVALSGTSTPPVSTIAITPAGVTLGLNYTQQYTAMASFQGVTSPMDVTNYATWTSGNTAVVTISPTGLATVISTPNPNVSVPINATIEGFNNSNNPAWLSTNSALPVICSTPTIDMKLLVINNKAAAYADFPAITQILDYVGTPYQVVDVTDAAPTLSDGACHGYYQGVIFANGGDYYGIGSWQQTLINYEITFKVRQLNWNSGTTPDFGLSSTGATISATQTYSTSFTTAGKSVFFYANTNTPLTITNAFVTLATPNTAGGGTATPLLQDSSGNVVAVVYTNPQGQTFLTQTFDSNENLTHNLVVAYGLLNWVSQGVFLGDYHVYASAQVDDFFINDSEWIPSTTCLINLATKDRTAPDASNLPVFRITPADMTQLVAWQYSVQTDPSGLFQPFKLTMAFNGVGTVGNGDWTGMTAPVISASATGGVVTFVAQAFSGQVGQAATVTGTTGGFDGTYTIVSVTPSASHTPPQTTFTAAFSGPDVPLTTQTGATVSVPDDLVANLQNYQGYFHWISHTYNHPSTLNGLCKDTPSNEPTCGDLANGNSPTDDIDLEILTNRWIASDPNALAAWGLLDQDPSDAGLKQLIFTDFNPANIVTPGVTGLNDPNVPGYLYADGIRYAVSDTSVIGQPNNGPNPSPNVGIVSEFNGVPTGIYEVPRYPNDIFYNAASWADDAAEFQCIYQNYVPPNSPPGTVPAPQYPYQGYNASQILDFTSGIFVTNMLKGDMDPQMFHQPDLHFSNNYAALTAPGPANQGAGTPFPPVTIPGLTPSSVGSLISDTYNLTFTKYKALYNLPVLSPTLDQTAALMQARNAYNLSGVTASLTGQFGSQTISITMPTGGSETTAVIPITGLNTPGAESYGGQFISHIPVTAGAAPITYPAP